MERGKEGEEGELKAGRARKHGRERGKGENGREGGRGIPIAHRLLALKPPSPTSLILLWSCRWASCAQLG